MAPLRRDQSIGPRIDISTSEMAMGPQSRAVLPVVITRLRDAPPGVVSDWQLEPGGSTYYGKRNTKRQAYGEETPDLAKNKEIRFVQDPVDQEKEGWGSILQFPENLSAQVLPSMVYDCRSRSPSLPMLYTPSMLLHACHVLLKSGWHRIPLRH